MNSNCCYPNSPPAVNMQCHWFFTFMRDLIISKLLISLLDGGRSLFLFSCLLQAIYTSWDNVEFSNMSHFSAFRSLSLFNLQRSWANTRKQGKRRNRRICCCIIAFKQARLFIIKWWNVSIVIWRHSETYSKAYSYLSVWQIYDLTCWFQDLN